MADIGDLQRGMRDLFSRLETTRAVAQSIVNATDEDSLDGRRARKWIQILDQLAKEAGA